MKGLAKTIACIFLISSAFACSTGSKNEDSSFADLPDSIAGKYLDNLAWATDRSIPLQARGFPSNQKGRSYFEERPYFDSLDRLKKVTVYEFRSDSFISYTHYYYRQERFFKMRQEVTGSGKVRGMAYYIFKGDQLIDSSSVLLKPIEVDTMIKRAAAYSRKFRKP